MANTSLSPELVKLSMELASAFAQSQKVVSAKARIGLFYQNPAATELFRKVSDYGETLRNKHMEGMPPTESEIAEFDKLRQDVVNNPLCKGFLEARQELDEMLAVVNQYMVMAIEKGTAPTDEEVAEAMTQQMSSCSCGGHCGGDCGDCENESCEHHHDDEHECCCGHHEDNHECCGGHGEGECCGKHKHDGECCGRHKHDEGHECRCKK